MERLTQSEIYYPGYQEPDSGVTGVAFGICRMTDGFWYDFDDSTFKNSGWTTQHQTMAEDANGFWLYTAGWAIPNSNSIYQIQWKITDATGTFYSEGTKIIVNSAVLNDLATEIAAIPANVLTATVEGTLELKQAIQAIMAFTANKASGGGTTTITFRDHADTKNRVVMIVNSSGDRPSITYNFD